MYSSPNTKGGYQMDQILSYPAPPTVGAIPGQYTQPPTQPTQVPPNPNYTPNAPTVGFQTPPHQVPYPMPVMQPPAPATNFYPAPNAPNQVPFGPYSNPLVPMGLESLLTLNQLVIEQQTEMLEAFTGYETNNKYIVKNMSGQHLYYAAEENDLCTRNCLGEARPFVLKLYDNTRNEILRFDRPWRCTSCCFPCWMQKLDVYGCGKKLGSIEQEWSLFIPNFAVLNSVGEKVLHIQGPLITFSCGGDVQFQVLSADQSTKVGKIRKQWSGLARELFTDADRFGVEFPRDLDVQIKAVLLGATFLIDFMYFERGHR